MVLVHVFTTHKNSVTRFTYWSLAIYQWKCPLLCGFFYSCSATQSMSPLSALQCFSAWVMKCAPRKSSKTSLNVAKAASFPGMRAAAATWTCWNSAVCRTWRRCLSHHGTSDSLLTMTTAGRKLWLQVNSRHTSFVVTSRCVFSVLEMIANLFHTKLL